MIMSNIALRATDFMSRGEYNELKEYLEPILEKEPENLDALHYLAECYAEDGDPENAYYTFIKLAELDPTGARDGCDKFLWLGQLASGEEAVKWYEIGLDMLRSRLSLIDQDTDTTTTSKNKSLSKAAERKLIQTKISETLCGLIEIWMTDLCMEPQAESTCEALIAEAIMTDADRPETWSVLGSIRISQLNNKDAVDALEKSWELYQDGEKYDLEVKDIPALIRLAQSLIEVELLETALDVTTVMQELDDEVADAYYLNGLAHYELYEKQKALNQPRKANKYAARAKDAWDFLTQFVAQLDQETQNDYSEMISNTQEKSSILPNVTPEDYSESDDDDEPMDEELNLED